MANPITPSDLFAEGFDASIDASIKILDKAVRSMEEKMNSIEEKASNLRKKLNEPIPKSKTDTGHEADEVAKLSQEYQDLLKKMGLYKNTLGELTKVKRDQNQIIKLEKEYANSLDGSYNKLSAEYKLLKISSDAMSESWLKESEEGKALVARLKELNVALANNKNINKQSSGNNAKEVHELNEAYKELLSKFGIYKNTVEEVTDIQRDQNNLMKLQGNYANSLEGSYNKLSAEYSLLVIAANTMSEEWLRETDEGKALVARLKEVRQKMSDTKEAYGDYRLSVGNYEKALNGLNLATKQVIRELPSLANSVGTFFIAISNNIPIFVDALKNAAKEAGSFKKALRDLITVQNALEAVLLISLTLLAKYGQQWLSNITIFQNANKVLKKQLELFRSIFQEQKNYSSLIRQEQVLQEEELSRVVERLKAENASLGQIQEAERNLLETRKANLKALKETYKDRFLDTDVIKDYESNLARLMTEEQKLVILQQKAVSNSKANGDLRKRDKEAIEAQQQLVDYYQVRVNAAEEIISAERELATQTIQLTQKQEQELYDLYRTEVDEVRNTEDLKLSLVDDRFEKERKIAIAQTRREIEDIDDLLNKAPGWLSPKRIEQLKQQRELLSQLLIKSIIDIKNDETEALINLQNETENITLNNLKEGQDKELAIYNAATEQKKKALERRLLYERELTEKERAEIQKQIDLLNTSQGIGQGSINLNYALRDLSTTLKLRLAIINSSKKSEYQIQKESIAAQIEYWKEYLDNIKKYGNLSVAELENVSKEVEAEILNLTKEGEMTRPKTLGDILGINSEDWSNIVQAYDYAIEYGKEYIGVLNDIAQAAIDAAQVQVDAAKSVLDYEMEARANGYANNVELARREYEEKMTLQRKAVEEQKKLQRAQEAIDTATQASSLITTTAEILKGYSSLPIVGLPLAIAAIAAMWGTFAAAKIKARELTSTTYGNGMAEYLDYGGSHASGNDIDFGTAKDGRRRRVERGEVIGVINKKNVRKYGPAEVMNIIDSLNKGTFDETYGNAFNGVTLLNSGSGTNLDRLENGVDTLVRQGEYRETIVGDKRVIQYKNLRRVITNA